MATLKDILRQNKTALGTWVTLGHPAIAEIMARAGYDFVTIDLEHSTISMREAGELIRTVELAGSAPLVRLSANDPVQIKRVMDAGAHGIIVPMVNSADNAQRAARAMLYPPHGVRGVGLARAQGYGASFEEYKAWLGEHAVLIAQIEHIDGVESLDSILAVPEVDGIIIGPYDLSASLGIPGQFDDPRLSDAIARIERTTLKSDKALGIHVVEPDMAALELRAAAGYRFLAYSLDIRMLDASARQGVLTLKHRKKTT